MIFRAWARDGWLRMRSSSQDVGILVEIRLGSLIEVVRVYGGIPMNRHFFFF